MELPHTFQPLNESTIPVVNNNGDCTGIISKSDYLQLQDKFTRISGKLAKKTNDKFFQSLLAKEVMTENPVTANKDTRVKDVIKIFLDNNIHSVVITENEKVIGITTPFDY